MYTTKKSEHSIGLTMLKNREKEQEHRILHRLGTCISQNFENRTNNEILGKEFYVYKNIQGLINLEIYKLENNSKHDNL